MSSIKNCDFCHIRELVCKETEIIENKMHSLWFYELKALPHSDEYLNSAGMIDLCDACLREVGEAIDGVFRRKNNIKSMKEEGK